MYEITLEGVFSAAHAISVRGVREPLHGHDWRVTVTVRGPRLDADGLLCDFHALEEVLHGVIHPLKDRNLLDAELLRGMNPTAENVAKRIAEEVDVRARPMLGPIGAWVARVRVTEAVGCSAAYEHGAGPA